MAASGSHDSTPSTTGSSFNWVHNLLETEDTLLSNIRGGWRNDRYSITAWVENLTDDDSVMQSRRFHGAALQRATTAIFSACPIRERLA